MCLLCGSCPVGQAADYNIRLVTDSMPDYTDITSFVRSITGPFTDPQDRAIAIWRWGRRSRHQTSCAWDRGRLIWDPVLHYTSYGYMNCGIIAGLNIAVAHHAGFQGRYIQLGDHTVSELSWDDGASWHLFDSSMSIFCYNHEGVVASCEEIKAEAACALSGGRREPGHFYLYHPAAQCASHLGPGGWRTASDNPVEYQRTLAAGAGSYTDGYSISRYSQMAQWGRRYILNLRPHSSYTRHWRMLDTSPGHYRPARGERNPDDPEANVITRTVRANGVWEFRPELSSPDWREFVHEHENLEVRAEIPHFAPREARRACRVVFKVDAANVITSMAITGSVVCPGDGSTVRLLVSRDAGLAWREVWKARGEGDESVDLALQEEIAGHTEALVAFEVLRAGETSRCGLASLAITTITQLNRLTLPRLGRGPNRVQLSLGAQEESLVFWPVLHGGAYRETASSEKDIYCRDETDSFYKATIGAGANGTPCHVVWRLVTPTEITGLTVGVRVCNRGGGHVSLQHSWDGETYREFFRKSDGSAPFDRMVLETLRPDSPGRSAWVRCEFLTARAAATYNTTGIQDIFMRVSHRPPVSSFRPIEVTYCWTEHRRTGDVTRQHTRVVTSPRDAWRINVGGYRDPTMHWLRLRLCGGDDAGEADAGGYADGEDVGESPAPPPPVVYRWGTNAAAGAFYSASREACDANGDDEGRELTDGIIIAPTARFASRWPEALRSATAGWDGKVRFEVDLGREAAVAGVRVCTHQPDQRYCHPARVDVSTSIDGRSWQAAGTIHHGDIWNPPGDYEPWEGDDDPAYAHLPAGGRLAYAYPLVFEPRRARFVRFDVRPRAGAGVGVSELQVFDRVRVLPWPGDGAISSLDGAE